MLMKDNKIMGFRGEFDFLSNFHAVSVEWKGFEWPTSENAYQWAKSFVFFSSDFSFAETEKFQNYTPAQAKKEGQKFNIDKKLWNKRKYQIMFEIVKEKFEQNPNLAQKLLDTGDAEIVELNNWGDVYWGVILKDGEYVGDNRLGEILMLVRSSLRGWGLVF